ncbi:TrbG/VirB9 family P-type conjugative transfer protein [Stenotrophomonas maltophilia]|uniref:TrbG/VirB9 family P-type conjugative transfer protein n=1 Tax=Stenotrophomonas maltophilia TaxID=40324 RepID=UPI003D7CEB6D
MRNAVVAGLVLAGGLWPELGVSAPASAALTEYAYEKDQIYSIRTALGLSTQIELSEYEKVLDYSVGLATGWDVVRRENVFYVRPKGLDVDSNLMVRTSKRSYIFELRVVATDWATLEQAKSTGTQYKVAFTYPGHDEAAVEVADDGHVSDRLDPNRSYHFAYDVRAFKRSLAWLTPRAVYDDGQFTYIQISGGKRHQTAAFPVVFARETERGEDMLVNTTVDGGTIVVHGIHPYLVLRQDNSVVAIRRRDAR